MKIISLFFVVALAGCSTAGELRSTAPLQTFASTRDAKAVSTCITKGFEGISSALIVDWRPTDTGYTVTVSASAFAGRDAAVDADIKTASTGSTTTYRSKLLMGEGKYTAIIIGCQA